MKLHKCFYRSDHPYAFRSGDTAEVIGIKFVEPDGPSGNHLPGRPCFEVRYEDGTIDYTPIYNTGDYELLGPDGEQSQ